MRTNTFLKIVVVGACYALAGTAYAAGDPEAGKFKFSTCTGCHGIPGYNNVYPTYHVPRLGGQHADYIVAALKEYQAGDRKHPTMHANAFSLSDQDMADIAAYVSTAKPYKESHPIKGNPEAGKQKAEACAACHGKDGNSTTPTFPRLASQHEDYLRKALQDYKSGARNNAIMNGMAAPLSDQDQKDLAAYFASQPDGVYVVKE
jgi:cytochrome c553